MRKITALAHVWTKEVTTPTDDINNICEILVETVFNEIPIDVAYAPHENVMDGIAEYGRCIPTNDPDIFDALVYNDYRAALKTGSSIIIYDGCGETGYKWTLVKFKRIY